MGRKANVGRECVNLLRSEVLCKWWVFFFLLFLVFKQCCHNMAKHICGSERLRWLLLIYNVKTSFRGHQICCSIFLCLSWNNPLIKRWGGMEMCLIHPAFQIQSRFIYNEEAFITFLTKTPTRAQIPPQCWPQRACLLKWLLQLAETFWCPSAEELQGRCSTAKQPLLCQKVCNNSVFP